MGGSTTVLVAYPAFAANSAVNSANELVTWARGKPDPVLVGAAGVAIMQTLGGNMLAEVGGFKVTHVIHKGGGPLLNELVSGQVQLATMALDFVLPLVREGKLKALGRLRDGAL